MLHGWKYALRIKTEENVFLIDHLKLIIASRIINFRRYECDGMRRRSWLTFWHRGFTFKF
jgi:hypothetical protein